MKKFMTLKRSRIGIIFGILLIGLIAGYILTRPGNPCDIPTSVSPPLLSDTAQQTLLGRTDLATITSANVSRLAEIKTIQFENPGITDVAFSPSGDILAAADKSVIKLIDVGTGQDIGALRGKQEQVLKIAFSSDGLQLAAATTDHGIYIWDLLTQSEAIVLKSLPSLAYDLAYTPDGAQFITAGAGNPTIRFWDATTYKQMNALDRDSVGSNSVSIHPSGKCLVVSEMPHGSSGSRAIRLLNLDATFEQTLPQVYDGNIAKVAFSPDGRLIASAGIDSTARIWQVTTGEPIAVFQEISDVLDLSFSPDGTLLATSGGDLGGRGDNSVQVWDVATQTRLANFRGLGNMVWAIAFSPDGKIIASGDQDGVLRFWGVASPS